MLKRVYVLLVLLLLASSFVLAQDNGSDNVSVGEDGIGIEDIPEKVEETRDFIEGEKWEYLGEKWKEILLRNQYTAAVHGALQKLNFLFVFFFGEPYDLSLTLLFIILLWFFFFAIFGKVLSSFSTFGKGISYIISFVMVIILAHVGVFEGISLLLFKLIFFKEGIWGWFWFVVFVISYFVILKYFERLVWKIGRSFKHSKKEREEWDEKFQHALFKKKVEGLEKAFGTIEGAMRK